jgi:phospholipase D1/2
MTELKSASNRYLALRVVGGLLLVAAIVTVYRSPLRSELTMENARELMAMLSGLWYGPALFIAAFAILGTLLVPATIFVVVGSLVWGWAEGGLYSIAGGTLAALLSYAIARWLGAGVLRRFGRRGTELADRLRDAGFRTLLILRLVPIFPFAMLNYAAGFANLRARDVLAATAIGVTPSMLIIAYSADALVRGTLTGEAAFQRMLIAGLLLAALALAPIALKRRAGKALHLEAE